MRMSSRLDRLTYRASWLTMATKQAALHALNEATGQRSPYKPTVHYQIISTEQGEGAFTHVVIFSRRVPNAHTINFEVALNEAGISPLPGPDETYFVLRGDGRLGDRFVQLVLDFANWEASGSGIGFGVPHAATAS